MVSRFSYLLLFHLLLLCGHGIYAVKDLKEKQQDSQIMSNMNEINAKDFAELLSQVLKDFEDAYSWFYFHKNDASKLTSDVVKDLQDKYSTAYFHKNGVANEENDASKLTSDVVKDLQDKYSTAYFHKNGVANEENDASKLTSVKC